MRRILVLVESNTTGTGRDFARRAAEMDVEPVLVTTDPSRYSYVAIDGVRHVHADTSNEAELLEAIGSLARDFDVAGVTSSSDHYVRQAAALARRLGLPGPSPGALGECQHKGRQRERLAAAGVPGPRYAAVDSEAAALESARAIGLPVVMKPVQGSGSFGVRLCLDEEEVRDHASSLLARTTNERNVPVARGLVVEEYLEGREFSAEVFRGKVLAIVRKHLGPTPAFVETGHDIPAGLGAADEKLLSECALRSVRALGLGWGACHVEMRLNHGRASVIEVNPRLAGGMIPDLVRRAYGVDMVRLQVAEALGSDAGWASSTRARPASIRFLTTGQSAVLRDPARAMVSVKELDGVLEVAIYKSIGDRIAPAIDFRGRIGHVLTLSHNTNSASGTADIAVEMLRDQILGLAQ